MTVYITPYRRITTLRDVMNHSTVAERALPARAEREMRLAVDVQANEDAYEILALVPGLEADDVNIEILNNTVSLAGEFKDGASEDSRYLVSELPSGRFGRVITLPTALDPSKAEATINNGVLHLVVPKAEAHRPKTIKIQAA